VPSASVRALDRTIGLSDVMRQSILSQGMPIPLPSLLLYKFVPFTKGMRVMARFTIWTALMTAALAAFGVSAVAAAAERRWGRGAGVALPLIVIGLVAFESAGRVPMMSVAPRPVDLWLAQQPDDVVIVELPVDQGTRGFQNYWATWHARRSLWGWSGDSFAPPILAERIAALHDFPSESSVRFLQRTSATYVLLTPTEIKDWDTMEARVRAVPVLRFEQQLGGVRVYRLQR
jgi:hypothetical protein